MSGRGLNFTEAKGNFLFTTLRIHRWAGEWQAYLQPNTFIPYSKAANVLDIVGL
ncbi:MAG: hypothetical protein ABI199_07390 [Bacteroidia bacterium]